MVGMKRPYPFFLDDSSGPSFNYKLRTLIRSDKPASSENGGQFNFRARKLILRWSKFFIYMLIFTSNVKIVVWSRKLYSFSQFRESPSSSIFYSKMESNTSIKGNEVLKGMSLSLSPPGNTSTCPSSKLKPLSACIALQDSIFPDFESLPYQVRSKNQKPYLILEILRFTIFQFFLNYWIY